jgi:nitroreductase
METLKAIEARKSARSYIEKTVEDDKLETLIRAGQSAPKAGGFHISVITNPELLRKIDEKTLHAMKNSSGFIKQRAEMEGYRPLYGAPVLFVISSPDGPSQEVNAACAAACVAIVATDLGLGSCYVGSPRMAFDGDAALRQTAGIPEDYAFRCGVLIGYAGEERFAPSLNYPLSVSYCR